MEIKKKIVQPFLPPFSVAFIPNLNHRLHLPHDYCWLGSEKVRAASLKSWVNGQWALCPSFLETNYVLAFDQAFDLTRFWSLLACPQVCYIVLVPPVFRFFLYKQWSIESTKIKLKFPAQKKTNIHKEFESSFNNNINSSTEG